MARFRVPPMSRALVLTTTLAFLVPGSFLLCAALWKVPLGGLGFALLVLYAAVWLWFRPLRYEVTDAKLEIVFPLRTRTIRLRDVRSADALPGALARNRLGFVVRVGVGGLFGVFGRLWTSRAGWLDAYITRLDKFVWLDRQHPHRSLILSVDDPDGFVQQLEGRIQASLPRSKAEP
ncbi:MAG: PH domain-containing protein [Myxococcota bacterium]